MASGFLPDETWKFGISAEQSIYTPVVLGDMINTMVANESPVTPSQSHLKSSKVDLQKTKIYSTHFLPQEAESDNRKQATTENCFDSLLMFTSSNLS